MRNVLGFGYLLLTLGCSSNGAEPSPRLREFVDSFGDHGVAGSVCADSYQQFYLDAVGIIDTKCEE